MIKSLPVSQQREIEARGRALVEEEMTLRDLRKARDLTQARLAETLNITQHTVSRIEERSDFLLSTLRSYVEAMGGHLRLVAEFPDRAPIVIGGVGHLTEQPRDQRRPRRRGSR